MRLIIRLLISLMIVSLSILNILGCSKRESVYGTEDDIIVIADSTDWDMVDDAAKSVFEKEFFTPQPEKAFTLRKISMEELDVYIKWRNICLVATLQTGGEVGKILNSMLTEQDHRRVENDSSYIFRKQDPWFRNQLLLVVVAKDTETLLNRFQDNEELLFDLFNQHASQLVAKELESNYRTQQIAETLAKEHGWTLNIQQDFFVAIDSLQAQFVWLRRLNPQRWFFVHYQQVDDPSILSEEWLEETRNNLTATYYKGDEIVDQFTQVNVVDFGGRYALRMDGHWENDSLNVGGAFRSYGFYDESSSRLYIIDLSVLAPGKRKLPFIRQLDAMAHTFKIIEPQKTSS